MEEAGDSEPKQAFSLSPLFDVSQELAADIDLMQIILFLSQESHGLPGQSCIPSYESSRQVHVNNVCDDTK